MFSFTYYWLGKALRSREASNNSTVTKLIDISIKVAYCEMRNRAGVDSIWAETDSRYSLFLALVWLVMAEMDSDAAIFRGFYLRVAGEGATWDSACDRYPSFASWVDNMRRTFPQKAKLTCMCRVCVLNCLVFLFFFPSSTWVNSYKKETVKKKKKGRRKKGSTSTNQTSLKRNQFFLNSKTIEHNSVICFNHIIFSLKVSNHMGGRFFLVFFLTKP